MSSATVAKARCARSSPRLPHAAAVKQRAGLMHRHRLVARLVSARDTPLILLVAPAGYGKTTLISEWARRDPRPFIWVDLREGEDEPFELVRSLSGALDESGLLKAGVVELPGVSDSALTEICEATGAGKFVLVLEGAHLLSAPDSFSMLVHLIEHQRPGSQVVLTSRSEPPLGLGGLRARRRLLELRSSDLAMTPSEAGDLMQACGLGLERTTLELLMHRTEGWPAALYLAALAAREEPDPARALAAFAGDDRFVADYIGDELLAGLPADEVRFLARLSVLDNLSGPLCDFVLERSGSARTLKTLSRGNPMVVPLDRGDTTYRYHRLFAQALRAELRRAEPEVEESLHARASTWFGERGDVHRSIEHAIAAGNIELAGDRLRSHSASLLGYGHRAKLDGWLSGFSSEQIAGEPALALTAAAVSLVDGDRNLVEHWTSAVLRHVDHSLHGEALLLRSATAEDAVGRMGQLADTACGELPEHSDWRALGDLLQGVAHHLTGDGDRAGRLLEEGVRRAGAQSPWIQSLCLAQLGLLAVEREDWATAESFAARAKAQVERSGLAEYPTCALVYAVSSEVLAHTGRIDASKAVARHASRLLSALPDFTPWYVGECRIALARAALRLGDIHQARGLVAAAARELQRSPDAQVALGWVKTCRTQVVRSSASAAGQEWCLTTAELRILQFLPTHLSLREIAERLYVSANTVKTHARSVYRKLGASSRGDAVVRARKAGLLDEALHAGVAAGGLAGLA